MFVLLSLRRGENKIVRRFVFRVQCIYCEMMSCLPCATCTFRMSSSCQFFSVFPRTIFHSFHAFSLLFFSFLLSFSLWCFFCFGVLLLPNSSSFPLHFLVSFLCFLLCFCSFMVDYSLVWSDCPSVSFSLLSCVVCLGL